jgi:hypothetical protein
MSKKIHKTENNVDEQVEQTTKSQTVSLTEAEKIWSEIKDKPISMFALKNAKISDYCLPQTVMPTKCFLITKASAVLPALEEAIGASFVCEAMNKYIVISRKV